jgi:hypothetical protein
MCRFLCFFCEALISENIPLAGSEGVESESVHTESDEEK